MDQQAKSIFLGIVAAIGALALLAALAFGSYYASRSDERRLERSFQALECSTDRMVAAESGRSLPSCR